MNHEGVRSSLNVGYYECRHCGAKREIKADGRSYSPWRKAGLEVPKCPGDGTEQPIEWARP